MIKVVNSIIPFAGYVAMTVFPFIFVRKDKSYKYDDVYDNHERGIHGRQQLEMLCVGALITAVLFLVGCSWWSLLALPIYFWWYLIEYGIRYVAYPSHKEAYRNISFEQEAYMNEEDFHYLTKRKWFAWVSYIGKKTYPDKQGKVKNLTFNNDNF